MYKINIENVFIFEVVDVRKVSRVILEREDGSVVDVYGSSVVVSPVTTATEPELSSDSEVYCNKREKLTRKKEEEDEDKEEIENFEEELPIEPNDVEPVQQAEHLQNVEDSIRDASFGASVHEDLIKVCFCFVFF
jgi:hypothetical protein